VIPSTVSVTPADVFLQTTWCQRPSVMVGPSWKSILPAEPVKAQRACSFFFCL
jgi:hypothetical protein